MRGASPENGAAITGARASRPGTGASRSGTKAPRFGASGVAVRDGGSRVRGQRHHGPGRRLPGSGPAASRLGPVASRCGGEASRSGRATSRLGAGASRLGARSCGPRRGRPDQEGRAAVGSRGPTVRRATPRRGPRRHGSARRHPGRGRGAPRFQAAASRSGRTTPRFRAATSRSRPRSATVPGGGIPLGVDDAAVPRLRITVRVDGVHGAAPPHPGQRPGAPRFASAASRSGARSATVRRRSMTVTEAKAPVPEERPRCVQGRHGYAPRIPLREPASRSRAAIAR